ncbi:hypothetical protein LINPERHAP1_LOCUS7209 [Linum perenne]
MDQCYKKNGYPPGYVPRGMMNQPNMSHAAAATSTSQQNLLSGLGGLRLTQEQYTQLQAFVQPSTSSSHHTNSGYTPTALSSTAANPSGPSFGEEDWYS